MKFLWLFAIFLVSVVADIKVVYEIPEWWIGRDIVRVIGGKSRDSRIFGGQEATPNRLPYQVGLLLFLKNSVDVGFCSGSLLSATRVVTAAHCVDVVFAIQAIFGAHLIDRMEDTQTRMNVPAENLIAHSNYSSKTLRNDIAMINLPTAVKLSPIIQPIQLPTDEVLMKSFVGETVRISGWGRFSASAVLSKSLRYVDVTVISNAACRLHFPTKFQDTNICTSGMGMGDVRSGTCSSDSGGPMTIKIDENLTLIGIASFVSGKGCNEGFPSSFTRVTSYIYWIRERLNARTMMTKIPEKAPEVEKIPENVVDKNNTMDRSFFSLVKRALLRRG